MQKLLERLEQLAREVQAEADDVCDECNAISINKCDEVGEYVDPDDLPRWANLEEKTRELRLLLVEIDLYRNRHSQPEPAQCV